MYIDVRLLYFTKKRFTYFVPENFRDNIALGLLVQVPIGKKFTAAIVENIIPAHNPLQHDFKIKAIESIFAFPHDIYFLTFIHTIAYFYQIDPLVLIRRIQSFLTEEEKEELKPTFYVNILTQNNAILTDQQKQVFETIYPAIANQHHDVFLLHGVTGSGKTEIYKKAIEACLNLSKAVIFMLPEVTLALQFQNILQKTFADTLVLGFHSASTRAQKKIVWQNILEQRPMIIIGVHLPILLAIGHLGLIIVDEEHDQGYQEKQHPKLHSRDMAILKAQHYHIPIILGSATPSIQSLANVQTKHWKFLQLRQRFAGKFPTIKLVSLKNNLQKDRWLHPELITAIQDRLTKKEQTIIFLNRRGYSFFVQCPCSFVFECHQCSVSLTLHNQNLLICHYCSYQEILSSACPSCKKYHPQDFIKTGIGTQQVVDMLQKKFPQAYIARADMDTTSKKRSWHLTVQDMMDNKIDILVGTQSISKGYHFAHVTLVGILWADLNLHFPIYNAAETTLQQLIQVAGRAGRQSDESLVIVQSFDHHTIFNYLDECTYLNFYNQEIENRTQAQYPPVYHIAEIEIKSEDQQKLQQESTFIAFQLRTWTDEQKIKVEILGPVSSLIYKIKKTYTYKILLKSISRKDMINLFNKIKTLNIDSSLFFVIDPVS